MPGTQRPGHVLTGMKHAASLVVLLVVATGSLRADAPLRPPQPVTQWSANRQFCAVSDPATDRLTVYRVSAGARSELWSVAGWQRSFAVSDTGDDVVTCYGGLSLLPLDYRPDETLLTFYRRGRATRSWTVAELIRDRTRLERTSSHYHWGECVGFAASGVFEVRTVDRGTLRFDPSTGALAK